MNATSRNLFDQQLEFVLKQMPPVVHRILEKVPLHVEDYPPDHVLEQFGTARHQMCGLYTGVPLTQRSIELSGNLPDVVTLYREGIIHLARSQSNQPGVEELREQIRITLLHEIGHHHGLDEDDLDALGYG